MVGGLLVFSESAIEVLSFSCTHNSIFPCRSFSISQKPIIVIATRRKNQRRSPTRSALSYEGGVVLDKDLEFKPSFAEYLKVMESVKVERHSDSQRESTTIRKRKSSKKLDHKEEEEDDEVTITKEDSRKAGFRDEIALETFKKQNRTTKILAGKKVVRSEAGFMDVERAAFRSLENEDGVVDKPRITRLDMEERIQKLAKCLNGADIEMPEWKFSQMMRSAQIRFSDHSILRIVQIFGKLGNWRRVLQVIEWMQSKERYKSHKLRYIYTAALDALGKARRPVEALNLFRSMQEQMASYPDIVAYHCISVTLGQAGHLKELFDVIDTMRSPPKKKFKTSLLEKWDPQLEPDVTVYNAVLNACVHRKKWEGAFWVLQQLSEQGQQPSSTTYGLVMEVMLECGKYNLVHDFFKKVQKSYIPNALIYKVLVNTLWKEGKTDQAVMAVQEMERRGIVGNAGLYYDLARCLCSAGRCHDALKQIDKICKVAHKPLVVTYTGLIQACLDSGHIKDGAHVFNHMQKFCSPNLVTHNIMLKAFLDHGMFEDAKHLFLRILENGKFISHKEDYKAKVIPDIYSFNTMLDACAMARKWDDLEFLYEQMLKYGHHFNAKRHLQLILDARRAGKEEMVEMTWKHLVAAERIPPPQLTAEMFCMRLEQRNYAAALSCFTNYASSEPQLISRKYWSRFFLENSSRFGENTIDELAHEASILLARGENAALKHLMESCKEFSRTQSRAEPEQSLATLVV